MKTKLFLSAGCSGGLQNFEQLDFDADGERIVMYL